MAVAYTSKILDHRGKHLRVVSDGWENPLTGHRTSRDKTTGTRIQPVAPSTDRQSLEDIYHGDDLGARIVDELVGDMLRKWIRLNVSMSDNSDADENVEAASEMIDALDSLCARAKIKEAMTWAQVFGGSVVFIGADDGGGDNIEDMAQPLRENAIRSIKFLDVYDRWDVDIESEYTDPMSEKFGQPETYRLRNSGSVRGQANLPELLIHETRTIRFDGVRVNRRRLLRNNGWHDPVYTRISQVLADFGLSWSSASHLLADFAPMVFTSPGLAASLAMDGPGVILDRMTQMDMCRSTVRMIPVDEGEMLERKSTPLSGMPDLLSLFILRMCAAARMPVTKLFGQSPSGLNTTAEGDLSFWYDRVESQQDADLRKQLEYLIRLLWLAKDGPTSGVEPESWALDFEKLWQLSQLEEVQARKTQAETDQIYIDNGVLMTDEVARSRFGGDRYSYETQLDEEIRAEEEQEEEQEGEPTSQIVTQPIATQQPEQLELNTQPSVTVSNTNEPQE